MHDIVLLAVQLSPKVQQLHMAMVAMATSALYDWQLRREGHNITMEKQDDDTIASKCYSSEPLTGIVRVVVAK